MASKPSGPPRDLRVLFVEDSRVDAELGMRTLTQAGFRVVQRVVASHAAFVDALRNFRPDIVLADFSMPGFDGLAALEAKRRLSPELPFIFVSGTIGEENAIAALRSGATDYVLKHNLARLPSAVDRALAEARERAERAELAEALRESQAGLLRAQLMAKLAHVVTGAGGAFERWSETLPQLIGVAPADIPRATRDWLDLVHAEDRHLLRAAALEGARTGRRVEVAYRLRRGEGAWIHLQQTMEPLLENARGSLRWFNTLQDVTEQKLAEQRIRRLNRVYAVLGGINSAMMRQRERSELFAECCRIAVQAGQFVMAWIGTVDPEAGLVKPIASAGDVRGFFDDAPLAVLESRPGGHGLAGRAIRAKAPMISNDVASDPQRLMRAELAERGIGSLAVIPLLIGDAAVGVLALYAAEAGFFDEEEMGLLTQLAEDVSLALEHIEKSEKLEYVSYYDTLTGAPNRALFDERLRVQLEDAARARARLGVLIVDIERFKMINDTLGRAAGDALLCEVGARLRRYAHPASWFARLGADQFAVVAPEVASEEDLARRIERRLEEVFAPPFVVGGSELRVSARIGVALFPGDGADAESLVRNAEAALKKAKKSGERYLFYAPEMTRRVADSLALENRLRKALEEEQFVLHYQPKFRAGGGAASVEALIRWRSPEQGLVPPAEFIPLLEETGLIMPVGSWALRRAALDRREWEESGRFAPGSAPRVAVNVSAIQMRQRNFVDMVREAIGDAPGAGIDLEITESVVMEEVEANIGKLRALERLGVEIAIDDFGTGYSSLGYLAKLPVHALKIDRSFVAKLGRDPNATTLVSTIITLAHALKLTVVAEGVETEAQADLLRSLGCDEMQGYLFSKPLPAEALLAFLEDAAAR